MSNIQTNFRAEDMLGAKKTEVKKVAPVTTTTSKKAPKSAPVVLEPVIVAEPVVEDVLETAVEAESEAK